MAQGAAITNGGDGAARDKRASLEHALVTLADASPSEILRWAADRYAPRLAFATGFGPEGLVIFDLIARHRLAVDVFTLDTGLLFPETYALWRRLEEKYGRGIRGVNPALDLEEQASRHGEKLWETAPDRCCGIRKVEPLERALAGYDAWITGIRREQSPTRADAKKVEWSERYGVWKIQPIVDWDSKRVDAYLTVNEVPYNALHDRGYPSIGCIHCTRPVASGICLDD